MTVKFARPGADTILASARHIYVSGCAAEIVELPELLRLHRPKEATITGIFSPLINRQSYADPEIGLKVRTFFLTSELRRQLATGLVDYCPWRYRVIDRWLAEPRRFDTGLAMMSPPDENGMCSLGLQTDFLPAFYGGIDRLVGFINPNMPRTAGDSMIPYNALAAVVDYDRPLKTMVQKQPDPAAVRIAQTIVGLIPDGATVQFGIGQIPSQVIARLVGHKGLRIHSGIVDDNILALEASGALDADSPIVTGTAIGSHELYGVLSGNDRFSFRSVGHTHRHEAIAAKDNFVAINSVLQVDLFGQASAEGSGGRLAASPGGLTDFVRGALASRRGKSIIAVRARGTAGHRGIVALLDPPHAVTNPASDADIVVTEFGAAHLRNLSFVRRAEALIAIADPEDQEDLLRLWSDIGRRSLG